MERVRVYARGGVPSRQGRGLFAAAFMKAHPLVPVEEEGRLNDPRIRENFIVRVFAYHRLRQLFAHRFSLGNFVKFHAGQKYLLLAHSPRHYAELGRLVARSKKIPADELREEYARLYMEALSCKTTTKKNVNVLHHIMGFLKNLLSDIEKRDILQTIEDYRKELVPLVVPLTLVRHYVDKHGIAYIQDQVYLHPHPKELMLRNHV